MNSRVMAPTLALVLLAMFATAFAVINFSNRVKVWPLMSSQSLTLVIGVSFVLGAGIGSLLVSLIQHRRTDSAASLISDELPTTNVQDTNQAVRL